MPRKTVSLEDIQNMNELYLKVHTYAGVAREVGFSASTVKKYIQPDYISQETIKNNIKLFSGVVCSEEKIKIPKSDYDWKNFFTISKEEKQEIEELRKEVRF